MRATEHTFDDSWLVGAAGAIGLAAFAVSVARPDWATVPVHVMWGALAITFARRAVNARTAFVIVVVVTTYTGYAVAIDRGNLEESSAEVITAAICFIMAAQSRELRRAVSLASALSEREHQLREGERQFFRNASHELRTPLTIAQGHLELVQMRTNDDVTREDLAIVHDELRRLTLTADRLLLLAMAGTPGFLRRRPVRVDDLAARWLERWRATADRDWVLSGSAIGTFDVDEDRLMAALDAVTENAVTFTSTGGRIELRVDTSAVTVTLSVRDDGVGMDSRQLDRMFDHFSRLRVEREPSAVGTGLGLAMARSLVEAHGGSMTAVSAVGEGTTIALTLARQASDGGPVEPPIATPSTATMS